MSYIGNQPTSVAFLTDQFSGNGSTTAFTMSVAPANTSSVLVAVSGVLQDPSTYSVTGTTLTFSGAPPTGTGNISARYLGIPASGVTTTAYRTVTEFTATANQKTFTPPSYTVGFINVYRNGVLLGSADYTATNGTTVVLTTGATSGDLVTVESFLVSSVLNAIPNTTGAISLSGGVVTGILPYASLPAGSVIQVVNAIYSTQTSTTSSSFSDTGLTATITPKFSTSKILVIVNHAGTYKSAGNTYIQIKLLRNATTLNYIESIGGYTNSTSTNGIGSCAINYLDNPATTSATTYKTQFCSGDGATAVFMQNINGVQSSSTITLLEIAQ